MPYPDEDIAKGAIMLSRDEIDSKAEEWKAWPNPLLPVLTLSSRNRCVTYNLKEGAGLLLLRYLRRESKRTLMCEVHILKPFANPRVQVQITGTDGMALYVPPLRKMLSVLEQDVRSISQLNVLAMTVKISWEGIEGNEQELTECMAVDMSAP